ncbi:preprotein translocase subunit SecG [Aequitasia blattaphilus]|uniref:AraC family transcriptional regulator n=1 Tax=Aequitasia blattaphilus TaxID=2949332 RepID=A0ABT1E961_9FIRM|nr:hypothetical protein [Aequitasia blattaphilus]MCP1102355.1 hypothetical protein [Aequitasia blattaphilus]MCR8614995.1 hypothetical protein [Aequitasia blattaphilus]
MKRNKITSLASVVFLFVFLILSSSYISSETSHEIQCHTSHCEVCQEIALCSTLLTSFLALVFVGTALFLLSLNSISKRNLREFLPFMTLVSLKVKLSN